MAGSIHSKPQSSRSLVLLLAFYVAMTLIVQVALVLLHYKSTLTDVRLILRSDELFTWLGYGKITLPILSFFLIFIVFHAICAGLVWLITSLLSRQFEFQRNAQACLASFLWLMLCVIVFGLNQYLYPKSFFASGFMHFDTKGIWLVVWSFSLLAFIVAAVMALIEAVKSKTHLMGTCFYGGLVLVLAGVFLPQSIFSHRKQKSAITHEQPNVIIIGLDSLRPDYIGSLTPHLDEFLRHGTVIKEVYTPISRTFPSWMTALTGQYPIHNGVRMNLIERGMVKSDGMLNNLLHERGYYTVYAMDERRFSNVAPDYGFDQVIGPAQGLNDFVLGSVGDFPLTNLFINSRLGPYLFPYQYANRAMFALYKPDSFLSLLEAALPNQGQQPIFAVIHLCLTHWPYTWADSKEVEGLAAEYALSVQAVDQQFADLAAILKRKGLLNNALIVVLSDHGTTLGLVGDRLSRNRTYVGDPARKKRIVRYSRIDEGDVLGDLPIYRSYGQGNDLLSLKQNAILLGFKQTSQKKGYFEPSRLPANLVDLAPTILDYLGLPLPQDFDGTSLWVASNDKALNKVFRPVFLETGLHVKQSEVANIDVQKVLSAAAGVYALNPQSGLVFLKTSMMPELIKHKQLGVMFENWYLIRLPSDTRAKFIPNKDGEVETKIYAVQPNYILVNLKTKKWSVGLDSALAREAPARKMVNMLNEFYQIG